MADAPPRTGTSTLKSYVVTLGMELRLVRAHDEVDARARVRAQLEVARPGLRLADDEITVRRATTADAHLLEIARGGSQAFRSAWARNLTDTAA